MARARHRRQPVLFARVGWMNCYDSERDPSEVPVGGGRYNENRVGSESENFRRFGRRLYGYVETRSNGGINLARLGGTADADFVDGVLVVFVARHPSEGRQRIVGWYEKARCHAAGANRTGFGMDGFFNCEAGVADGVLLDPADRTQVVPKGKPGTMGQSNVFYGEFPQARGKAGAWIDAAVRFVRTRRSSQQRSSDTPLPLPIYVSVPEQIKTQAPKPFTKDPETLDRALGVHGRLQNELAKLARVHGHEVVRSTSGWPEFDLGWRDGRGFVVAEIKSLDVINEIQQIRYGIGQLLDYRSRLTRRFPSVRAVLAVERAPSDAHWLGLCRRVGIDLVWPDTFSRLFDTRRRVR